MRRHTIVALLGLLLLAAIEAQYIAQQPAVQHLSRTYDVTDIVGLDSSIQSGPPAWMDDYILPPEVAAIDNSRGTIGAHNDVSLGMNVYRLQEVLSELVELATGEDDLHITEMSAANRCLLRLIAPARGHEAVTLLLDQLRGASMARVRITAYRGDSLLGSASGRVGNRLMIGSTTTRQFARDTFCYRGSLSGIGPVHGSEFESLEIQGLKLPDGRIRLQGWFRTRTEQSVRSLPTPRGDMELPVYRVIHVPIVADLADPGILEVPIPGGPALVLHARCAQDIPHFDCRLHDGTKCEYRSVIGGLRLNLFTNDPLHFYPHYARRWEYYAWSGELSFLLIDSDLLPLQGPFSTLETKPVGHLVCRVNESIGEKDDGGHAWAELVNRLDGAAPATYRVRCWQVASSVDPDGVERVGKPTYELLSSALPGQASCAFDVLATQVLAKYAIPAADSTPRVAPFLNGHVAGSYLSVSEFGGRVMATFSLQHEVAPIVRFTTTDESGITRTVEHTTSARRVFEWEEELAPGESATSVQPAEDGKVWVARLERLS